MKKQITPEEILHQVPTVYELSDTEDDSKRTITLSSPSQKLFLSSQETLSQDNDNELTIYENLSTRDQSGTQQEDSDDLDNVLDNVVTVKKQVFDDLVRKASTECDLQYLVVLVNFGFSSCT